MRDYKKWNKKEIDFLKENINKMNNQELANSLNRSLDSVKMKIREEKIIRKNFKEPAITLEGEEWRVIEYAPDYAVSNYGRVKKIKGNFLKRTNLNGSNYRIIHLSINGKECSFNLHRVVAMAFVPNDDPKNKNQVNHKDGNKENNRADNLEWSTRSDNINHAYVNGLYKQTVDVKTVTRICELLSEKKYKNADIAEMIGLERTNTGLITRIKTRKSWKTISKNYDW